MRTQLNEQATVLDAALAYTGAGLSVIPVRGDGSKAPDGDVLPMEYDVNTGKYRATWKPFQTRTPTEAEVRGWFDGNAGRGTAIVTGNGLEVLDFDRPGLFEQWAALVQETVPGVVARLPRVQTPRDGMHLYYRCETIGGNTKLARDENGKTLIETRGEGGYVLAPPSPGCCHPTGRPYVHLAGPALTDVPFITPQERQALHDAARSFNRKPCRVVNDTQRASAGGLRPGDAFNAQATWEDVLRPAGWTVARQNVPVTYWRRPGKDDPGWSATTGHCGDLFYCFTSNGAPFESETAYTKFTAYALLYHGGDQAAAARELAGQGYGEVRAAASAGAQTVVDIATDVPNEAPDDPHRLARLFVERHCQHPKGRTLHYWRDEWHRWDGAAYQVVPDGEVRAELCGAIKTEFDRVNLEELRDYEQRARAGQLRRGEEPPAVRKVTQSLVGNVRQALTGLAVLGAHVEQPAWLGGEAPFPADEVLAARNGLVHLLSLVQGKPHWLPPTPRFFSPNVLGYDFEADAPEPGEWLKFLGDLWPDDPQSVATLQEWFGYCLLPDTRQQKMLLLVGPKRSGKGTIARVLKELVGGDNVAGPTLSGLAGGFGLAPLLGKTVAVISDARLSGRTDSAVITERLLSISGEDTLTVDRKHLPAVSVKLAARFLILTNELPRLNDASGALAGRMVLLRLTRSWFGKEDAHLTDRLLADLPGILRWAVEGWARLRQRGRFQQPDSGRELVGHLEDLGSPIGEFIRESCEVEPESKVPKEVLFHAWQKWCEANGRAHAGDLATFGRNLLAAVPAVRASQQRAGDRRMPVYAGIRLRAG